MNRRIYMTDENPQKGKFRVVEIQFKNINNEYTEAIPMTLQKRTPIGLLEVVWELKESSWGAVRRGVKNKIEHFVLDEVFKDQKFATPLKEVSGIKIEYIDSKRVVWI